MYSLVLMAAMTTSPDVPQALLCPVTPSNYGGTFWLKHCFYDCCAPSRYGWVNCWNKGFGYYPGNARSFCGGCCTTYGHFYQPTICGTCSTGSCGFGGGGACCNHTWCGLDWCIGNKPAFYTSICGCGPQMTAAPYAYYTQKCPCSKYGHFAFDSGLIGHSHGVGYAGFGGYGNFGFYGAVSMQHPPTTADIPPFMPRDYHMPNTIPAGGSTYAPPGASVPMPMIPKANNPGLNPPDTLIPKAPTFPPIPPADTPKDKKDEPKKVEKTPLATSTVILNVPANAKVFVETHFLKGDAAERSFRTPNLQPGQEYVYTVKAYVTVGDSEIEETKQVTVRAGETTRASFDQLIAKTQSLKSAVVGVSGQK